jgi:hypothetical protein
MRVNHFMNFHKKKKEKKLEFEAIRYKLRFKNKL